VLAFYVAFLPPGVVGRARGLLPAAPRWGALVALVALLGLWGLGALAEAADPAGVDRAIGHATRGLVVVLVLLVAGIGVRVWRGERVARQRRGLHPVLAAGSACSCSTR
jgi:hypothetical protein